MKSTHSQAVHRPSQLCRSREVAAAAVARGKAPVASALRTSGRSRPDARPGAGEPMAPAVYTCPMHPGIRRAGPGSCPICGMALEPLEPTAMGGGNPELLEMTLRFWAAAAMAGVMLILSISASALQGEVSPRSLQWIELALATPAVLWVGWPLLQRGWESLRRRALNMFTLIALGIGAAYVYSLVATLAPRLFPAALRTTGGVIPVYFEAAALVTALVLLGQVLELRARETTGTAIRELLNLAPKSALRIRADGTDEQIPLAAVQVGDRLRVRPGEAVPVDGSILTGESAVDESMVTGEALPVAKASGAGVIAGTINGTGVLVIHAERVGSNTMLARIVHLVAEAQRTRAPIQRLADVVSSWFVPAVILIAVATFCLWMLAGPSPELAYALVAAVSTLIIACPCALGLATPMSIMVGVGRGATAGVLIRSAEALERLEKIDTLVIDKTGTLTEGRPWVVAVAVTNGFDESTLLSLAEALERSSEHPLAGAITAGARQRGVPLKEATQFRSLSGQGVTGIVEGRRVAVGNVGLLQALGAVPGDLEADAERLRREGATSIFVVIDGLLAGLIAVADPVKASTPMALENLRSEGIRVVMVTGDHRSTAEAIARRLGIADFEADVLPERKDAIVRRLRDEGCVVAMAGDGVNDAPALARADVGIAMGTGTDVAIQSAGVVLVKGDLEGIARARSLSRATMRNVRQNLFLAFIYNALGIPIAAGALYPVAGFLLSPAIAAAAMSASSVSVIGNALRLRSARL